MVFVIEAAEIQFYIYNIKYKLRKIKTITSANYSNPI